MKDFKWHKPNYLKDQISDGDVRIVMMPVKFHFEYSINIVDDIDPNGDICGYREGFIMTPVPGQSFIYSDQETILYCRTEKEDGK